MLHVYLMDTQREQCGDGAARGGAEADHGSPETPAVRARGADQLQRVHHRAVAGELVVSVKHVQAEITLLGPAIHGLPRNQRQPTIDRHLRERLVLNAVRPPPQNLARRQLHQIPQHRLAKQHHVALGHQLLARAHPGHVLGEPSIRGAEAFTVAVLGEHAAPQAGVDPLDVRRVDRQPALVGFAAGPDDTQRQVLHSPRA